MGSASRFVAVRRVVRRPRKAGSEIRSHQTTTLNAGTEQLQTEPEDHEKKSRGRENILKRRNSGRSTPFDGSAVLVGHSTPVKLRLVFNSATGWASGSIGRRTTVAQGTFGHTVVTPSFATRQSRAGPGVETASRDSPPIRKRGHERAGRSGQAGNWDRFPVRQAVWQCGAARPQPTTEASMRRRLPGKGRFCCGNGREVLMTGFRDAGQLRSVCMMTTLSCQRCVTNYQTHVQLLKPPSNIDRFPINAFFPPWYR